MKDRYEEAFDEVCIQIARLLFNQNPTHVEIDLVKCWAHSHQIFQIIRTTDPAMIPDADIGNFSPQ